MCNSNIILSAEPGIGMVVLYGVIGLLLVFLVLALLIGIIYLMKLAFAMFRKTKTVTPAENKNDATIVDNLPVQDNAVADDEIAAVIGAVLGLYCVNDVENVKTAPFKVKKIYRIK